jgi:LuxR family transcriptional regulator, maltose regulon positive regulatory protein
MDDWIEQSLKVGNYYAAFAYAMAEKADILTAQGHLREAFKTYQQALDLASEHESGVLRVTAHHYLGMAMLCHEMGDDHAAGRHLQKSMELAGLHRSVDWSYRSCVAQARMKESAGELDAALQLINEAKRFYIKTLIPNTRPVDAIKARIHLKQGRLAKAEEWVTEQGLSADDAPIYLHEFEYMILARVLLAGYLENRDERELQKALNLLERLLHAAEDGKRMGSMLEILVTQALVYQGQGNTAGAFTSLERALKLAEPEGYLRIFLDEGAGMVQLLGEAARRRILPEYVGRLLKTYEAGQLVRAGDSPLPRMTALQPLVELSPLVEALSQRELEVLRLFRTELSGPEIARELMVALSTVRTHTKSIYSKLNVNSRQAAVKRAAELKLI